MRLGIDFGTTRTVVAAADRGNFPIVSFDSPSGDTRTWFPSLVAAGPSGERLFAFDAEACWGRPGWSFLRSFKRLLGDASPEAPITFGGATVPAAELLTEFLAQLKKDLKERSNLDLGAREQLEAFVAVPANSNSNQRFITLDAFNKAGFKVLGMVNEPSAAGIEFAHRHGARQPSRREYLVVYDLGGGTFDASVISLKSGVYEVLANDGIARLGGDDFDEILKQEVLERLGHPALSPQAEYGLLELCRHEKEALHPNSRRIIVDASEVIPGTEPVTVPAAEFHERCVPLVARTIEAIESAVRLGVPESGGVWDAVTALYLVGGSSDLPAVARTLRERYGRKVRRSAYPYAATAIGLAVAADSLGSYELRERFTRYFGVWREADGGQRVVFDPIFPKDARLPGAQEPDLVSSRLYHPAHNIGCFRYLECTRIDAAGNPSGDLTPWDPVFFPFDPRLHNRNRLDKIDVERRPEFEAHAAEERYRCNSQGIIEVIIADHTTGYSRSYRLRRH